MRCGNCGMNFDASGTYASGGSCPGCGGQMSPEAVFNQTVNARQSGPSSGAPALSAGGWGGRPRYRVGSSIGEILEATFRFWGQTLLPNGLLQCMPMALSIPLGIAAFVFAMMFGEMFDSAVIVGSIFGTLFLIVSIAHAAAYLGSFVILDDTARAQGDENPISAFGTGVRRIPALIGASIVFCLGYLVLVIAPVGAISYASDVVGGAVALVLSIPLCYFALRVSLMVPAMMIEELGPLEAIARSFDLTRGNVLTTFVSGLVVGALGMTLFVFLALFSLIPVIGMFASLAISVVVTTLATSYYFALFAGFRDAAENRMHGEV